MDDDLNKIENEKNIKYKFKFLFENFEVPKILKEIYSIDYEKQMFENKKILAEKKNDPILKREILLCKKQMKEKEIEEINELNDEAFIQECPI